MSIVAGSDMCYVAICSCGCGAMVGAYVDRPDLREREELKRMAQAAIDEQRCKDTAEYEATGLSPFTDAEIDAVMRVGMRRLHWQGRKSLRVVPRVVDKVASGRGTRFEDGGGAA